MKQYLMAVHMVEGMAPPEPDVMQEMYAAVERFNQELRDAGAWVFAGGLQLPDGAAVVRAEGGEVLITDGPFAEAKEQLGGFWIITAVDRDAALAWATKASAACAGPVEVREFQDEPEV